MTEDIQSSDTAGNTAPISVGIVDPTDLSSEGIRLVVESARDMIVINQFDDFDAAFRSTHSRDLGTLIISDFRATGDGPAVISSVGFKTRNVKTPIIMVHPFCPNSVKHCLSAGVRGFCMPNISAPSLLDAIRSVYGGALWLDGRIDAFVSSLHVNRISSDFGAQDSLSLREKEVLVLIVQGLSNKQISDRLVVTLSTVKAHVRSILTKLRCEDRTQAAVIALRIGLVQ